MLSPHIYVALAHERHQTFLAQAETDRRNRRARPHRQRGRRGDGQAGSTPRRVRGADPAGPQRALEYEITLRPAE